MTRPNGPHDGVPMRWETEDPTTLPSLPEGEKWVPIAERPTPDDPNTQRIEQNLTIDEDGWIVVDLSTQELEDRVALLAEQHKQARLALARERAEQAELVNIEAEAALLTDAEAVANPTMFPAYELGANLDTGQRFYHPASGKVFRVLQPHATAFQFDPETAVSLYEEVQVLPEGDLCDTAPLWDAADVGTYNPGTNVRSGNAVYEATGTTHLWVDPADAQNGSISWTKVKDCPV